MATSIINNDNANKKYVPFYGASVRMITNALAIDAQNQFSDANAVGYVYSGGSSGIPSDLNNGIREVFWYNASSIMIKISGVNSNGYYCEWGNVYNGSSWTGWQKLTDFTSAISSLAGTVATKSSSLSMANVESDATNLLSLHIEGNNGNYILAATSTNLTLFQWDSSISNWVVKWSK